MASYISGRHSFGSKPSLHEANDRLVPRPIEIPGRLIKKISAGDDFSVALDSYGFLYSWGRQKEGQCGRGIFREPADPGRIDALATDIVDDIVAGAQHCLAVTLTGKLYHFGVAFQQSDTSRSNTHLFGVSNQRLEGMHRSMVMASHAIYISGDDDVSLSEMAASLAEAERLGESGAAQTEGMETEGERGAASRFVGRRLRRTAALEERAREFSGEAAAVKMAESVMKTFRRVCLARPTRINTPRGERVISVGAGFGFTVFVTSSGGVYSYGMNDKGQCGTGDRVTRDFSCPARVALVQGEGVIQVSCGQAHTLARTNSGLLFGWGLNSFGQLGVPHVTEARVPKLVEALQDVKITSVACGSFHTMCIDADSRVFAFGHSEYGQTGSGDIGDEGSSSIKLAEACTPRWIKTMPRNSTVIKVACGSLHSLCLTADGVAYSFGFGGTGTLGTGNRKFYVTPTQIEHFDQVHISDISAGPNHSLFVVSDGSTSSADLHSLSSSLSKYAHKEVKSTSITITSVKSGDFSVAVHPLLAHARSSKLRAMRAMISKWSLGVQQLAGTAQEAIKLRRGRATELKVIAKYLHGEELAPDYPRAFLQPLRKVASELGLRGLVNIIDRRIEGKSPRGHEHTLGDDLFSLLWIGDNADIFIAAGDLIKDLEIFPCSTLALQARRFLQSVSEPRNDGLDRVLPLHSFILSARSLYFQGALTGAFRETDTFESLWKLFPSLSSMYCVFVYIYSGKMPYERIVLPWETKAMSASLHSADDGTVPVLCTLEEALETLLAGNAVMVEGITDAVGSTIETAAKKIVDFAHEYSNDSDEHEKYKVSSSDSSWEQKEEIEGTILSIVEAILSVAENNVAPRLWRTTAHTLQYLRETRFRGAQELIDQLLSSEELTDEQRDILAGV